MSSQFNPRELSDFARYYGFHYDSLDPAVLAKEILIDMERGLDGRGSSLPMIPSYITTESKVRPGKSVLALDAGGTNLRVSRVRFDEASKAVAEGTQKHPMPGTKGRVGADEFFDMIADAVLPVLGDAAGTGDAGDIGGIGFTFSYHMDIQPDADGILLAFSKEIDAPEVIGKAIGAGLRQALARKGRAYDGPIVLLNDTAATLLSGIAAIPGDGPVIGCILGTGFNTAYPETCIPKIGFESRDAPQIVVCETGTFNLRYRGLLDREFDDTTKTPGTYALEKATSGAYLGPLTLHILKRAVRDKVIHFAQSDEFLALPGLDTRTLSDFCRDPFAAEGPAGSPLGSLFGPGETDAISSVQYIASIVAERGAMFAAAVLAATVRRMQGDLPQAAPIRIAMEGTTYMAYKGMRRSLDAWLHTLLVREMPRPYVVAPVDQASLFGAAVAASG